MELIVSSSIHLIIGIIALPILGLWVLWNVFRTIEYFLYLKKHRTPELELSFKGFRHRLIVALILFALMLLYTIWPFLLALVTYD